MKTTLASRILAVNYDYLLGAIAFFTIAIMMIFGFAQRFINFSGTLNELAVFTLAFIASIFCAVAAFNKK